MKKSNISKIIYFDKETISNILQEIDKGNKTIQRGSSSTVKGSGELEVNAQLKLSVPLIKRIAFLFPEKYLPIILSNTIELQQLLQQKYQNLNV